MDTKHEGHRGRLYKKVQSGSLLADHEILEIMLFNAYPRINTNPIAHELLDRFGSLKGVLEADFERLTEVNGVGESVACYIKIIATVASLSYSSESKDVILSNYGDFKEFAASRLRNKTEEVFEVYFLEKNGRVINIYSQTDLDRHKVTISREKIMSLIAAINPYGILIAHNHLSGSSVPSSADRDFTAQMQMICSLNKIIFYDHCIYAADNDVYSFFETGTIGEMKRIYNVPNIISGKP